MSVAPVNDVVRPTGMSPEQQQRLYDEGLQYFKRKDYHQAFELWNRAAVEGHPIALCDVGWMYGQGKGVPVDKEMAFKYTEASAERQYARAQNNLGLYYKLGTGVPVDMHKAVFWLERAKQVGYGKLAIKTLKEAKTAIGEPVDDDMSDSSRTSKRSAQEAYDEGLKYFTKKDYPLALKLWQEAADGGHSAAMCDIGWMYGQGNGVEKDHVKAFQYTEKAALAGFARAQNNLGLYYKKGSGCKVDDAKAVYWLEKAEAAGYKKLAVKTLNEAREKLALQSLHDRRAKQGQSVEEYRIAVRDLLLERQTTLNELRIRFAIDDLLHEQVLREELASLGLADSGLDEKEAGGMGPQKGECIICMDERAEYALLYCMHLCLCKSCASQFRDRPNLDKGKGQCPVCRAPVEKVKKIFALGQDRPPLRS